MSQRKKNRSTKLNVAQNIQYKEKNHNSRIKQKTVDEMKKTKSIKFETIEEKKFVKKVIKSIVMHVNMQKSCVKVTRRRIRCLRRFLL